MYIVSLNKIFIVEKYINLKSKKYYCAYSNIKYVFNISNK